MMRAINGVVVAVLPQHRSRLACLDDLGHNLSSEEQDDLALEFGIATATRTLAASWYAHAH